MPFYSNLHTHTTYSDGTSTVEDYIKAAIQQGFVSIGFSDHSPVGVPYAQDKDLFSPSMEQQDYPRYREEISTLRTQYCGQIEIYLGLEEDYLPFVPRTDLDYTIGSVHYLTSPLDGSILTIDYRHEDFQRAIQAFGTVENLVRAYYDAVVRIAQQYQPEIVGHLDLITKLNQDIRYFNPNDSWYRTVVLNTIAHIAKTDCIVEVNTGAIAHGYAKNPYPDAWILQALCSASVPVTISSDCHSVAELSVAFDLSEKLLYQAGYRSVQQMQGGRFSTIPLVP